MSENDRVFGDLREWKINNIKLQIQRLNAKLVLSEIRYHQPIKRIVMDDTPPWEKD